MLTEGFLVTSMEESVATAQAAKTTHQLFLNGACLASQSRIRQVGTYERDGAIDREMHLLQLLGFYQFSAAAVAEEGLGWGVISRCSNTGIC